MHIVNCKQDIYYIINYQPLSTMRFKMKKVMATFLTIILINCSYIPFAASKSLCDGPAGGLLCGAGIGGGIGSALDGEEGAKTGAIFGGLMGLAAGINEAEQNKKYDDHSEHHVIISNDYPALLVYNTQIALISIGYYVGMYDGSFTNETSDAIKSYQKDNNLIVNGIPTEELYERIKRDVAKLYTQE